MLPVKKSMMFLYPSNAVSTDYHESLNMNIEYIRKVGLQERSKKALRESNFHESSIFIAFFKNVLHSHGPM